MAAHWFPRMTPAVRAYQCRFAAPRAIPYPLMASTCHGECEVLVSLRTTGGFHSRPGSKNQTASLKVLRNCLSNTRAGINRRMTVN